MWPPLLHTLLLLGCIAFTLAADLRVYEFYADRCIAGYNVAWADASELATVRTCMDDCVAKGVTNLRSVDYTKTRSACACQNVNFEEVGMSGSAEYNTYMYRTTLTDVAAYVCVGVSRSHWHHEGHCEKIGVGAAFTDSVIIVDTGGYPFGSGQLVNSRKQCAYLCLFDEACNAYIIENSSAGFPANCIKFYNFE